jgi:EAL and modified HD-GYP domain-containing signal transduction protein
MLSLIDAMLDSDIHELLNNMPLSETIQQALIAKKGSLALMVVLSTKLEHGEWHKVDDAAEALGLSTTEVMKYYEDAADWTDTHINLI